jgi:hypothetical protein
MDRRSTIFRRARWGAAAVALLAALTVTAPGTVAMAAEAAPTEESDEFTIQNAQGFSVTNLLANATMEAEGAKQFYSRNEARFDNDKPAAAGERFEAGFGDTFSLTHWFLYENASYLQYSFFTSAGVHLGHVTLVASVDGFTGTPSLRCDGVTGDLTCETSGQNAYIFAKTPTVTTVEATQSQEQADVLMRLCDIENAHIDCSFEPKGELVQSLGGPHELKGGTTMNGNCKSQTLSRYSFTWGIEQGFSTSFGGSISAGGTLADIVELSVSLNFQETWSWTHVKQESHAADIAPGYWTWIEQHPARLTVSGDFTAIIGNDTVHVRDVAFEAPDVLRYGNGVIISLERIMLPAERVQFCRESPEVAQRRYDLVLAASPDGATEVPGAGDPIEEASVAEAPAFTEPEQIAEFEAAFEAAG